jgi:hypothetical protein
MPVSTPQSTYEKVLALNLNPLVYGTFAEIGAGQEVANRFFRASGTAGTVAKTISAYDMTMSDAIYGGAQRYVSRQRLSAMLEHEFGILCERLSPERGDRSTFFSFCNTVRARGYQDDGECHGWLGIRFQRSIRPVAGRPLTFASRWAALNTRLLRSTGTAAERGVRCTANDNGAGDW